MQPIITCSDNEISLIFSNSTSFIHNQVYYLIISRQPIINLIFNSDYIDMFDIYDFLFKNHHLFQKYNYPKIFEIQIMSHPFFPKFLYLNKMKRL